MGEYWQFLREEAQKRKAARQAAREMNKPALKKYREQIREAWLPLTGLKKLKSRDYRLVERWFDEGVDLKFVLRAIEEVKGNAVYSLGYITGRVERLRREAQKSEVGGQKTEGRRQKAEGSTDEQREEWRLLIEEMYVAFQGHDLERAAMCKELLGVLDELSLEEILRRIKGL
ncbi:MAG: hypothetical protein AABN33_18235 [Acidobacteriota bacterium]